MLTKKDIRAIIEDVVVEFDVSTIKDDQDFKDVGIDSLDHITILLAIEEQYGFKIPDKDIDQCSSITGILSYLSSSTK